ncbi:MAG: macro domain-containing protein [Clostridium sp.]|nr:macro domain-containing protein [Clostridium sp.]
MIHHVKGDLLASEAQALVNTVNTVGVMGKGIALQFREQFPENYKAYRKACLSKSFKVGEMFVTEESNQNNVIKTIINFPTKTHWRLPSEYTYISQGLLALKDTITQRGIKSIAIPALGSSNGGLDWTKVRSMIEDELKDTNCEIFIYEPTDAIADRMKAKRANLTPARAMVLLMIADMNKYGEFASVFAVEKMVYFMQRFGGKGIFKIDFKPYIYGPYSGGKVAHVLYYLNGSYIKGMNGMQNKPFDYIWLTEDAESEAAKYLSSTVGDDLCAICHRTQEFLWPFYSNYALELISTVDYILNSNTALNDWQNKDSRLVFSIINEEIHKWSTRKERLFKPEHLETAFNHLKLYGDFL